MPPSKNSLVKYKDKPEIFRRAFYYDKNERSARRRNQSGSRINRMMQMDAFEISKTALENGKAVVSANKKMIA